MSILIADGVKLLKTKQAHDPEEAKYYTYNYKPNTWTLNKEYLVDSVVIPTVPNGLYYVCINPGVSGATEPIWNTVLKTTTSDGNIRWRAVAYNFLLNTGDIITASSWACIEGAILSITDASVTTSKTTCKVSVTSHNLTYFVLTNAISILRSDSKTVIYNRSLSVPILTL